MCRDPAAHSALAVREVHVTPAGERANDDRWHRTQPRTRPQSASRAELLTPHVATVPRDVREQRRGAHKRSLVTHTRAKTQSDGNAQTRTCAHNGTRASRDARARTQRARTQMRTNTQMNTYTNSHAHCTHTHTHMLARLHTPKNPVEDQAHPRYPLVPPSTPTVLAPRRHRVGSPHYRARALPSTR